MVRRGGVVVVLFSVRVFLFSVSFCLVCLFSVVC